MRCWAAGIGAKTIYICKAERSPRCASIVPGTGSHACLWPWRRFRRLFGRFVVFSVSRCTQKRTQLLHGPSYKRRRPVSVRQVILIVFIDSSRCWCVTRFRAWCAGTAGGRCLVVVPGLVGRAIRTLRYSLPCPVLHRCRVVEVPAGLCSAGGQTLVVRRRCGGSG